MAGFRPRTGSEPAHLPLVAVFVRFPGAGVEHSARNDILYISQKKLSVLAIT
jgi:hypothetical protein